MTRRKQILPPEEELSALESRLAVALQPVRPPREAIRRLRGRIHFPTREELARRLGDWRRLFLVFAGVMAGMMALITLARVFYYLAGRRS